MEIKLPDRSCTGCGVCLLNCKAGAITMKPHDDGFLYPFIDTDSCIQCGQCMRSCHAMNENEMNQPIACYAAQLMDKEVLSRSTSGGMFFALASSVLNRNGIVYGCAYDEQYNASIVRAASFDQLQPIHGSKYVWSDPCKSYPLVKHDLENGREVLYTCLPCQAAGLKKYLHRSYDNLYIVDVLCGGSPSPYAFQKYLETVTDEAGKKNLISNFGTKKSTAPAWIAPICGTGKNTTNHGLKTVIIFLSLPSRVLSGENPVMSATIKACIECQT